MKIKTFLWFVLMFMFGVNLAVTFVNKERVDSLLTTRRINNMRISDLQLRVSQVEKVVRKLAKARLF